MLIKQGEGEPLSKPSNRSQIGHSLIGGQTMISAEWLNQIEYNRKDPKRERICWVSYLQSSAEINQGIRLPRGERIVKRLIETQSTCRST